MFRNDVNPVLFSAPYEARFVCAFGYLWRVKAGTFAIIGEAQTLPESD